MPNEMNPQEVAKGMLERIDRPYSAHAIALDETEIGLLRRIANGKLVEVVHASWIEDGDIQICSECGEEHEWQDYRASYCENCGALMNGKDDNDVK